MPYRALPAMISDADFDDEVFEGIELSGESGRGCTFSNCMFVRCRISDCTFEGFRFSECTFRDCRIISNRFVKCTARGLAFFDCALIGIIFTHLAPHGLGSPLERATGCTLKYCQFEKIEMPKTVFRGSDILECTFAECNLSKADFSGYGMAGTEFSFSDLSDADFRDACGYSVNLKTCKAKGAVFSFPEAMHLLDAFGIKFV